MFTIDSAERPNAVGNKNTDCIAAVSDVMQTIFIHREKFCCVIQERTAARYIDPQRLIG